MVLLCSPGWRYNFCSATDRNECEEWGFCDQRCSNTEGSYTCSCYPGYQLLDKARCVSPNSNNLLVFFAHDRSVYRMDSHGRNQQLIANTTTASGLDFHFAKNLLYWTDIKTKKVRGLNLYFLGNISSFPTKFMNCSTRPTLIAGNSQSLLASLANQTLKVLNIYFVFFYGQIIYYKFGTWFSLEIGGQIYQKWN